MANVKRTFLHISPVAPFRLDLTVWALRRQPHNRYDLWDGRVYTRVLVIDGSPLVAEVVQEGPPEEPVLLLSVLSHEPVSREKIATAVAPSLVKMLGTNEDVADFYRLARHDQKLKLLARRFAGV